MELNGPTVTFVFVFFQGLVQRASAATCGYISDKGVKRYTFCLQRCCDDNDRTYTNVCCPYGDKKEVYMGAGMATLIVLSIFAICFTYVCCKQRCRQAQQNQSRSRNRQQSTGTQERNQNSIPTISLQVEPIQPPAYDALPPPYYTREPGTSNKKEELSAFDDGPPPAYTP